MCSPTHDGVHVIPGPGFPGFSQPETLLAGGETRAPRSRDSGITCRTWALHSVCKGHPQLLFTENETNNARLFGTANRTPYVKDGIDRYVVADEQEAVNPDQAGTEAAAPPGSTSERVRRLYPPATQGYQSQMLRLVLSSKRPLNSVATRRMRFRQRDLSRGMSRDAPTVMRQALAGMLWSSNTFFIWYRLACGTWRGPVIRNSRRSRNRVGST